jgi:hypothetical protein
MEEKLTHTISIRVTKEDHERFETTPRLKRIELAEQIRKLINGLPTQESSSP